MVKKLHKMLPCFMLYLQVNLFALLGQNFMEKAELNTVFGIVLH